MLKEMSEILNELGFAAASEQKMGHYVIERAFTEQ